MERTDYRQIFILIGTTLAVYLAFRYLLPLIVPFLFSYFIAILVQPIVIFTKKKWKCSRGISGAVCIVALLVLIGIGIFGIGKILFGQIKNIIANMPTYELLFLNEIEEICNRFDGLLGVQVGNTFQFVNVRLDEGMLHFEKEVLPFFSTEIFSFQTIGSLSKIFDVFWILFIIVMGAFFIIKDMEDLKIIFEESSFFSIAKRLFGNMGQVGNAYLKAELIIIVSCAVVCVGGFCILRVPNSLFWGIAISLFDALPALGSGVIFIPWAIFDLIKGNWYEAAVLFTIYIVCQLVHEIVEAKILGDKIGIKPVFTLISMYVGTELFGIAGFILGPFGFLMIKNVVQSQY